MASPHYGSSDAEFWSGTNQSESIFGNDGDDTLNGMAGADTIVGGKDDDVLSGGNGADTFVYYLGDGNDIITDYSESDKIKVGSTVTPRITTNGNNVIFTFGRGSNTGTITIKNGKSKTITWLDVNGNEHVYPDPLTVSDDGKAVTLNAPYGEDSFNVTAVDSLGWDSSQIATINASAVGQSLVITANKRANNIVGTNQKDTIYGGAGADTIYGGKGNDTIYGGDGADVFMYNRGDGNDKIVDYEEDDTIKITGDDVKNTNEKGNDVVFTLSSGKKITVVGGADKVISYSDSKNPYGTSYGSDGDDVVYSTDGKSATLKASYDDGTFYVPGLEGKYKTKLLNIDASAVEQSLVITANSKSNSIIGTNQKDTISGGAGADTISGGKGDDTLYGGDGADVFAYSYGDGNDKIQDYDEEDTIKITGDRVIGVTERNDDVVLKLASNKKITVVGGVDKVISYSDTLGQHYYVDPDPDNVTYSADGKSATLKASYNDVTFNVPGLADTNYAKKLLNIDASRVEQGLTIMANGKANKIIGTSQDDAIYGGNGADSINGGAGKDSLWGGNGDDTLFGGAGNDVFYYNGDGDDVIGDYVRGQDKIVYQGGVIGSVYNSEVSGNDVIFTMSNGNTLTVKNAASSGAKIVNSSGTTLREYPL